MPQEGYVYIVQGVNTHYVKIGQSTSPLERIKTLEQGLPFPLRILLIQYVEDMTQAEQQLLGEYQAYNTRGEWFAMPQNLTLQRFAPYNIPPQAIQETTAGATYLPRPAITRENLLHIFDALILACFDIRFGPRDYEWIRYRILGPILPKPIPGDEAETCFEESFNRLCKRRAVIVAKFIGEKPLFLPREMQAMYEQYHAEQQREAHRLAYGQQEPVINGPTEAA